MTFRNGVARALSSTLGIRDIHSGIQHFDHGRGLLKIGQGLAKFAGTTMMMEDLLVSPFIGHRSLLMKGARRMAPSLEGNSLIAEGIPRSLKRSVVRKNGYRPIAQARELEMTPRMPMTPENQIRRLNLATLNITNEEYRHIAPRTYYTFMQRISGLNHTNRFLPDSVVGEIDSFLPKYSSVENDGEIIRNAIHYRLRQHGGTNISKSLKKYGNSRWTTNAYDRAYPLPIARNPLVRQHRLQQVGLSAYDEITNATPELQHTLNTLQRGEFGQEYSRSLYRIRSDMNYAIQIGEMIIPLRLMNILAPMFSLTLMGYLVYSVIPSTKKGWLVENKDKV